MTIKTQAIYAGGSLQLQQPLPVPDGTEVQINIHLDSPCAVPNDPLAAVIGIGEGPASGDAAAKHDDYLYGTP
jgi:hypothetical protein